MEGTLTTRRPTVLALAVATCVTVALALMPAPADGYVFGMYRATVSGTIDYRATVTSPNRCVETGTASLSASFKSRRAAQVSLSYAPISGKRGLRWYAGFTRRPVPSLKGTVSFEDATSVPPADAECDLPPRSCDPVGLGSKAQATLTGLRGRHMAIGVRDLIGHALADNPFDGDAATYCPVAGFHDFSRFAGLEKDRFGTTAIRFAANPKRFHVCSRPGSRTVLRASDSKQGTSERGSKTVAASATRRIKLTLVKKREIPEIAAACRRGEIRYPWERRKRG